MKKVFRVEKLLNWIDKGCTCEQLVEIMGVHKSRLISECEKLLRSNASFESENKVKDFVENNYIYKTYNGKGSIILAADLHWGSEHENKEYVNKMFEYALNNKVTDIILLGDLIDGFVDKSIDGCKTHKDQLMNFINNYPKIHGIKTLALLGNHDFLVEKNMKVGLNKKIENLRDDFLLMGYKKSYIRIGDENIIFKHTTEKCADFVPVRDSQYYFLGHSHKYNYKISKGKHVFNVPHLFREIHNFDENKDPGFIKLDYNTDENSIVTSYVKINENLDVCEKDVVTLKK